MQTRSTTRRSSVVVYETLSLKRERKWNEKWENDEEGKRKEKRIEKKEGKKENPETNNNTEERKVIVKYSENHIPESIYHTVIEPQYNWDLPYPLEGNILFKVYPKRMGKWFDFKTFHLSIFYINYVEPLYDGYICPNEFEKSLSEHAKERNLPIKWVEMAYLTCKREYRHSVYRMIIFDLLRKMSGADVAMTICSYIRR